MLTATDEALQHLSNLLEERETPDGTVVRCVVEDGSLALVPSAEKPGDTVFRHEDRAVLVVDNELSSALEGREFHVETTNDGAQLALR